MGGRRLDGMKVDMFSEHRIALIKECGEHPALLAKLAKTDPTDWPERVGCIAAHCGIAMDGWYLDDRFEELYPILYKKLNDSRSIIVGIH